MYQLRTSALCQFVMGCVKLWLHNTVLDLLWDPSPMAWISACNEDASQQGRR